MYIAHVSDLHIMKNNPLSIERALKVIDTINSFEVLPKAVIVSGDLIEDGTEKDYEKCFEVLNHLKMPYYVVSGNHDNVNDLLLSLRKYSPNHPASELDENLQYVVELENVKIIAVDNGNSATMNNQESNNCISWLENKLNESLENEKLIILFHRFPFRLNVGFFDRKFVDDNSRLCDLLSKHKKKIKLITCGHLHHGVFSMFDNIPVAAVPSPCFQLNVNFQKSSSMIRDFNMNSFYIHYFDGFKFDTHIIPVSWEIVNDN